MNNNGMEKNIYINILNYFFDGDGYYALMFKGEFLNGKKKWERKRI